MLMSLLLAAVLSGCAAEDQKQMLPSQGSTSAPAAQTASPTRTPEETIAQSTALPETEPQPIPVETPYGTLYHQSQWEGLLLTEQTMTDGVLCVTFLAEIDGTGYRLFQVTIGGPEANAGTICDGEGTRRNVLVQVEELGALAELTGEQRNMLYAMQEEINFVIDKLT